MNRTKIFLELIGSVSKFVNLVIEWSDLLFIVLRMSMIVNIDTLTSKLKNHTDE